VETVFIGLGTNLGNRLANLREAVDRLERRGHYSVVSISPVYETAPWGITDQPDFLNLCIEARTDLPPVAAMQELLQVEEAMGRTRGERWGPRLIDLDLVFYGETVLDVEGLTVPHPRIPERAFLLAPLSDLAPEFVHPSLGQKVAELYAQIREPDVARLPLPLFWGRRTFVMGILNVTPDSFSGDGVLGQERWVEAAAQQAAAFAADGADYIDVGAESTRPGSTPIEPEEEKARLLPVIAAVRKAVRLPISVDTYRSSVAAAALDAGADIVNDVWGLRMDPDMAGLVADKGCPIVIMHNRSQPKDVMQEEQLGGRYVGVEYDDLLTDIAAELRIQINVALDAGIMPEQIIIDPGIGFGKTVAQNLELIDRLGELRALGFPLLVGPSRKSFIGYTLGLPVDERMEGTGATVAIAIDRGADIVRVHDVKPLLRVARMTDHIVRK
jgi:dihydropteroate synthase/2-amino-4-hydroxy-6-hydroxymethyldihydropteridine diphosphokinase